MDIIENRKFIIQDIKNELNRKQMKLIQFEIGSIDYEKKLLEIETLKNELELAMKLDSLNDENIYKTVELLKKYEYILELPQEKIIEMINIIESFKEYKDLADIKINIPNNISEIHKYPYKRIINLEDLKDFRYNVENKRYLYKTETAKLKEKFAVINIEAYNKLFQNVKNSTISNLKDLQKLSNLGLESKINRIKKLHKDLIIWKIVNNILQVFSKEEQIEYIDNIKAKILVLEQEILEDANSHIRYLITYNNSLNIRLENEENINLSTMYLKVKDMIEEKDKSYEHVLSECAKIEEKLYKGDIQLENLLKQIDESLLENINEIGINPEDLTKSKITRLLARKNLMNRLLHIKENETVLKKV